MAADNKIAEFHRELKLKKAFFGYDTCEVLNSYKKLDNLYREIFDDENTELLEKTKTLSEKIKNQELHIETLTTENQKLIEKSEQLQKENSELRSSDEERQIYLAKAEVLSAAMLTIKREAEEKRQQIELERQEIIDNARQEAKTLLEEQQAENTRLVNAAKSEVSELENKKAKINEQLRQIKALVAEQFKVLTPNEADKK